jgi:hypothetical protein
METIQTQPSDSPLVPVATLTERYIESLSVKEKKAYLIAREHLGTSFSLEKSVGFLAWKANQPSSSE